MHFSGQRLSRQAAPRVLMLVAFALALLAAGTGTHLVTSYAAADSVTEDGCGAVVPHRSDGRPWSCTFADDFSGRTLDPDKWAVGATGETGNHYAVDCLVDDPRNVSVGDGVLRLSLRRLDKPVACPSPYGAFLTRWTAGMVTTSHRFAQRYGRVEIRAAFPAAKGPGMHGALWLYPQQETYGRWPASGEIDVAEHRTVEPDHAVPTLHYGRLGADARETNWNCRIGDASQFHTYVLEWTPSAITITYDGRTCLHSTAWAGPDGGPGGAPFDQPFFLLLSQGRGVGLNSPNGATPAVGTMQVDYVRVWQ